MKKAILPFILLIFVSYSAIAQDNFTANSDSSTIYWKGFKPTGEHNGTIAIEQGNFTVANGEITGGEFIIDMNSIVNLDLEAGGTYNTKLVNHLKSDDFFDTAVYPTAVFKITGTEKKGNQTLIKGDLTLKDKTNPVSFLADVNLNGNNLNVKSETFKVDRSKWNVRYGSKSFFDDLADKFIEDMMEISFNVNAEK
jgi:polyisoprenoid-binding protein YceI